MCLCHSWIIFPSDGHAVISKFSSCRKKNWVFLFHLFIILIILYIGTVSSVLAHALNSAILACAKALELKYIKKSRCELPFETDASPFSTTHYGVCFSNFLATAEHFPPSPLKQ